MKRSFFPFASLALLLLPLPGTAQGPKLLKDLNTLPDKTLSSFPGGTSYDPGNLQGWPRFLPAGKICFFNADDGIHGRELWVSGNAPGTTRMVKDIFPGPKGSGPDHFTLFQGKAYFSAFDPKAGNEVRVSDGTAGGTHLVADILPGREGGGFYSGVVMGKSLYFFARVSTGPDRFGLFRYDGGTRPPRLLKGGFSKPWAQPVPAGSFLLFQGTTPQRGASAWVSDGTAGGTALLPGFSGSGYSHFCVNPVALGGWIWFSAGDSQGWGLWKTAGKKAVLVTRRPLSSWGWMGPVPAGTKIVFAADPYAANPYVLDTTTGKWASLNPNPTGRGPGYAGPVSWKGYVYFLRSEVAAGFPSYALWRTDGTVKGTVKVVPESIFPDRGWHSAAVSGNYLFFSGGSTAGTLALWRTDGTARGTIPLEARGGNVIHTFAMNLTPLGGKLLYSAYRSNTGNELFASDGTPAGTGLLKDIFPGTGTKGSQASFFTPGFTRCWFTAQTTLFSPARGLWTTMGTAGTTAEILPGKGLSVSAAPVFHEGILLFTGMAPGKRGFWRSDGTAAGTLCYYPNFEFQLLLRKPLPLGDKLVFQGKTSREGAEPWVTDGTAKGTALLKDILPGRKSGGFDGAVALGRAALFSASDGAGGSTLWVTDGTPQGTRRVLPDLVRCSNLVRLGGRILFEGMKKNSLFGMEAWVTDGTSRGTHRLLDLYKGTGSGRFLSPFRAGDRVLFLGTDGTTGGPSTYGLFATDGTAKGTVRVGTSLFTGIREITGARGPWGISLPGGKALFWPVHAKDANKGPWVTDGTSKGTFLLKDTGRALLARDKVSAVRIGAGRVWFLSIPAPFLLPAVIPTLDTIWESDGTPQGTGPVPALKNSGLKSFLWPASAWKGKAFFSGEDGIHGFEPWTLGIGAMARPVGFSSGRAELVSNDPVLGRRFAFALRDLPRNASALFLLGMPCAAPLRLGPDQRIYLDPKPGFLWAGILPGGRGSWSLPGVPALAGTRLALQAVTWPSSAPPLGIDVTNGIFLTLGTR